MENEYTLIDFIEDFEKREGLEEEEKLFYYLDYAVRDENFNEALFFRKSDGQDRYDRVNKLLNKTPQRVIDSNIYLKKCKEFMYDLKGDCIDLLLDHKASDNDRVSKELSTEKLLPLIDEPELLGLEIVQRYNEISSNITKMYNEIARLNLWNLINKETKSSYDIGTVTVKDIDGIKGTLTAVFQDKKKINGYLGYVKKKAND